MIFKRFMSAGLAAATGLTMAMAGSSAQATILEYRDTQNPSNGPTVQLTIDDNSGGSFFTLTLSTLADTGAGDFLSFGFDWMGSNTLTLASSYADMANGSIQYLDAYNPPGSTNGDGTANTDGQFTKVGPTSDLAVLFDDSELCVGPTDRCGPGGPFGGGVKELDSDGNPTSDNAVFDYVLNIGDQGTSGGVTEAVDEFVFTIAAPDGKADLVNNNPFKNLFAGRLQSTSDEPDKLGGGSVSAPLTQYMAPPPCEEPNCPNNTPLVPEIDGPVLIQVGFALGGLYLLLLGRRREEDELAHAA